MARKTDTSDQHFKLCEQGFSLLVKLKQSERATSQTPKSQHSPYNPQLACSPCLETRYAARKKQRDRLVIILALYLKLAYTE